jgi:hypothetical protein
VPAEADHVWHPAFDEEVRDQLRTVHGLNHLSLASLRDTQCIA